MPTKKSLNLSTEFYVFYRFDNIQFSEKKLIIFASEKVGILWRDTSQGQVLTQEKGLPDFLEAQFVDFRRILLYIHFIVNFQQTDFVKILFSFPF